MPKITKKTIRKGVDKAADVVTDFVGARDLSTYWADKIIQRQYPEWQNRVTKGQALNSAGNLALSIGSLAAGGAVGGVAKAASNTKKAKVAKEAAETKRWENFVRRTYSGYEREAMKQAAKRNTTLNLKK